LTGGLAATGPGALLDINFGYTVTELEPTQAINSLSMAFNGTATGPAGLNDVLVSITETVRSGNSIVGQISVTSPLDLQDPPYEPFDINLSGTFTTLNVTKDIILSVSGSAQPGVGGSISIVDQDYGQTDVSPVPEPATLALIGTGLIGAGLLRRRKAA
jgi:hypothetical protein